MLRRNTRIGRRQFVAGGIAAAAAGLDCTQKTMRAAGKTDTGADDESPDAGAPGADRPAAADMAADTAAEGAAADVRRVDDATAAEDSAAVARGTVVDCHVHFNSPKGANYPSDWLKVARPAGVASTVVIEASTALADDDDILAMAEKTTAIVGFSGNLPLGKPGFADLARKYAGNRFFRGIRVDDSVIAAAMTSAATLADFQLMADLNLEIDAHIHPESIRAAAQLAQRVPKLRIVIDHLAYVLYKGGAIPAAYVADMTAAAQNPNLYCKVSYLVEGTGKAGAAPADPAFYKPVIDVVWKAFGEDRLIFGSNWPVCLAYASYQTTFDIVKAYFAAKGPAAEDKFFATNARAAYQWIAR